MRTIIINTLGSELRQNPLFYLPFPAEQFLWIEQPLDKIEACVEQLCCYHDAQDVKEGCHVMVLVSLAHYRLACYEKLREAQKKILFAHLNTKLLLPLVRDRKQQLSGVSVVYVLPQPMEGTSGIPTEDIELHLLGLDSCAEDLDTVVMHDDNGNQTVDLTEQFSNILNDFRMVRKQMQDTGMCQTDDSGRNGLRRAVEAKLTQLQSCKYFRPGDETQHTLAVEQIEYWMLTDDWNLFCVDLQLNLSEYLQTTAVCGKHLSFKPVSHDADVLQDRIGLALQRVNYLQEHAPKLAFFEADQSAFAPAEQDITGAIWTKLKENTELPGMKEAELAAALDREIREAKVQEEKESIGKKLRLNWLLIGREKKHFDGLYQSFQEQYTPEAAAKQQTILDTCADVFLEWRQKLLSRKEVFPVEAKASQIPVFDRAEKEMELAQAHQEWGEAAVDQLEDYTDLREQAEKIKSNFRKAYRLWPDGAFNATSKFCVYSAVLAVLFVLQMLLPYIGITMGQEGVELSRYVHFSLSIVIFISLYAVGVLFWMQALCRQLQEYTLQMKMLLQDSYSRRTESIINAVQAYGRVLPRCMLCYEKLQHLLQIHEENLQRKERYNTHMQLLSKAEELLHELCTMLRLPNVRKSEKVEAHGGINFELPPNYPENVPYYVFMSEKWGRS